MSGFAERIDEYLSTSPLESESPLTDVTGLSQQRTGGYADPDATPEGYYGRNTAVETVGELVCSDATVRAVPSQWREKAVIDLLRVPMTPVDAADIVTRRRDADGGLRRLFGAPASDDFDSSELTDDDLALLRFYTAFGSAAEMGTANDFTNLDAVRRDDVRSAYHWRMQYCWRASRHDPGVDLDRMRSPSTVSEVIQMSQRDEVLLTTATDPTALADDDVLDGSVTTHLPAILVVAASLLFRRNFARPETLSDAYIAPAIDDRSDATPSGMFCVFTAPDSDLCYGFTTESGDRRMRGGELTRVVRDYLLSDSDDAEPADR